MEASAPTNASHLGTRLKVYKPHAGKVILLGIFLIGIGAFCAIEGFIHTTFVTVYSSSATSIEDWVTNTGIVLCLIGGISILLVIGNRKLRAYTYEQGFVVTNKTGSTEVRWDQITHVWHKNTDVKTTEVKDPKTGTITPTIRKTSTDIYTVQSQDGSICEIDTNFFGLSDFGKFIEQTYPRYLFPRALQEYNEQKEATFGTLTISPEGIRNTTSEGVVQLPWKSFQSLSVDKDKGKIMLHKGGSEPELWSTVSMNDTPNLAIFEALANTLNTNGSSGK